MKIDVVDVQKSDAPRRFARSLHETGFAVLVNHQIPFDVVQRVWSEWLDFFKSETKWEFVQNSGEQDGYRSMEGSELAVGAKVKDIKEYFHFYPWGRCPADLKESASLLFTSGASLARTLLSWVEDESPISVKEGFSMPLPNMLDDSHRTLLRILHYPPLKGDEPEGAVRAAAHEDINLLTVLPASNEPGLQVQSLDGSWFDVPCDPGSIAVNAGDMLAMASGGFYPSTTHRVLNPPSSSENRSRCSTPLFLHPADDVVLSVKDGKPYRAFDFLDDRLRAITGDGLRR